jgi:hypothetical protein
MTTLTWKEVATRLNCCVKTAQRIVASTPGVRRVMRPKGCRAIGIIAADMPLLVRIDRVTAPKR